VVIVVMCLITMLIHRLSPPPADAGDEDPVGLILMQVQGKYLVGAARSFLFSPTALYAQSKTVLNTGTVGQRQRFIIIAADLGGPAEARRLLDRLDADIDDPPMGGPVELSESQASVQRVLHELYPGPPADLEGPPGAEIAAEAAAALSKAEREELVERLGWFGRLALAPPATVDRAARAAVLRPARIVAVVLVTAVLLGAVAGAVGFAGLVLVVVLALTGKLHSGLGVARSHHAVYAETFAVWLVVFLGLQLLSGLLAILFAGMLIPSVMFFASLIALVWPVVRGVPWRTVRQDVGLTLGRPPWAEPLIGLGGYLGTIPLVAVGLLMTLGLMAAQSALSGAQPTFAPSGGPAHPVIVHMSGPDLWPKIQVLFLAAVAAPIVEETMFRGVLYRHLRDATGKLGFVLSVLLSSTIGGLVFAAMHPQGIVAIPALMSLAYGMALIREWRGTLVPSIVIHAVSNGLIMSMLMIVLGV
jgi:membrane protease YdiL (CAAX protease family)